MGQNRLQNLFSLFIMNSFSIIVRYKLEKKLYAL